MTVADTAEVRPWHPAGRPDGERAALKSLVDRLKREPPFEQLGRPVFALTEVEHLSGTLRRWADRRLDQRKLQALARKLGWQYELMWVEGQTNFPVKTVPAWGLQAVLGMTTPDDAVRGWATLQYVTSGLLDLRRDGRAIPACVMSELLHEVERMTTECVA